MLQLFINGQQCDLKGDENISIDYAMFSIEDISKRKGSRSFNFELPKTLNNSRIFKVSEQVNNSTTLPYTKLTARLLDNGVDLGIKFAELTAVKKGYSINLYGDNAGFFDIIKNALLTDLDLSDLNHTYNIATIFASRLNDTGYIYPIINYGIDENVMGNVERIFAANFALPAIYLDTILPRICSQNGYTLVNSMLDDSDYVSNPIILPATGLVFANKYNATFALNTFSSSVATPNAFGSVNIINVDSIVDYTGNWYSLPYNSQYNWGATISTGKGFAIQDVFTCKFRIEIEVNNTSSINLPLRLNLTGDSISYHSGSTQISFNWCSPGTHTYIIEGTLNDDINQWLGFNTKMIFPIGDSRLIVGAGTLEISEADAFSIVYPNSVVDIAAFLPNMKQSDLLRNYCQMFCLLPVVDEDNKTVTLTNFNQIEENINSAVDWSDKLDLIDSPEVKFLVDEYAQRNFFKWLKDEDEQQVNGTNWILGIPNENLQLEKDIIELQFASSYSDLQLLDIPVPRIGIFETNEYKKERKPRMLILYRKSPNDFTDTSDFVYQFGILTPSTISGSSATIPLCRFIETEFDYNLGFGNSLNNYQRAVKNIVDNYKSVTCALRLNASDINQLDFMNPVWVKYFNSYFYISKISGYNGTKSTQVELIKLF